jgi:hypothetical protein
MVLKTLSIHPVIPAIFKPESSAVLPSGFCELGFRLKLVPAGFKPGDRRNDEQRFPNQGHLLKLMAMREGGNRVWQQVFLDSRLRGNDESVVPGFCRSKVLRAKFKKAVRVGLLFAP